MGAANLHFCLSRLSNLFGDRGEFSAKAEKREKCKYEMVCRENASSSSSSSLSVTTGWPFDGVATFFHSNSSLCGYIVRTVSGRCEEFLLKQFASI